MHGGYNYWGEWAACSVSCGAGNQSRMRQCNNPAPSGNGNNCSSIGPGTEIRGCTMSDCLTG